MIKISKSSGIFYKIKNAFIGSNESSITNDNLNLNSTISNPNIENSLSDNSSIKKPILDDNNLSGVPLNTSAIQDSITTHSTYNSDTVHSLNDNSMCWNILDTGTNNYTTTGKRRILFKIEKYKFNYPLSKSTTLHYYPNLPIIQSLEHTTKTKHDSSQTTTILCNNMQVTIPIEYDYDEVTFRPYVSYSIALYNQKPTSTLNPILQPGCPLDINNLDIYALESDSLFLAPFTMCFPVPARDFFPSDFIITATITDPLGGEVSPVCVFDDYYLYEVEVNIELKLAPAIDLSNININTLNVLNTKLGKSANNTIFTQYELESVTDINFSGFSGLSSREYLADNLLTLDYKIFNYLPNLVSLNISNTNANINTASNFEFLGLLKKLKILIAENNYFTDYSTFSSLTNFIDTLTTLNLSNTKPLVNDIATLDAPFIDIYPLTIFTNLTLLNLSGNTLSELPASIKNLSNLTNLNLSNNSLSVLPSEFSTLINLVDLNLSENNISDLSVSSSFTNLKILNISGNPIDPNTIENLPVTDLDYSNSNLNNQSLLALKLSDKIQKLDISGNHISDLTSLSKYNIEIIATNQLIDYGQLHILEVEAYYLDLDSFLLDTDGYVPCIDYISNGGYCGSVESCDCVSITWLGVSDNTNAYFTFSNITDTFTGKVIVELVSIPV